MVSHAGSRLLSDLTDATGLTRAYGDALRWLRPRGTGRLRRSEHPQDLLVFGREHLGDGILTPVRNRRACYRATGQLAALPYLFTQHLGHRFPGAGQLHQGAFRRHERGLHPVGLLPQPGHLLTDLLLPGLQHSEHRRHSHLHGRDEQTNRPISPACRRSSCPPTSNHTITSGKRSLLRLWRSAGTGPGRVRKWNPEAVWIHLDSTA
ncbi:hypothetical protein ACFY5F_46155 [Streptomyces sp. NPDC013161]|uniref:hypothetical protein n=1 Tax=Streptomyces sp. NPDC013161 TaxID=3364862 RepID=UPI0036A80510